MPSTVEQLSATRVKITVEVPFAELKPSMDKAYREIAKQVNVPGSSPAVSTCSSSRRAWTCCRRRRR